jgi:hypothetical protein
MRYKCQRLPPGSFSPHASIHTTSKQNKGSPIIYAASRGHRAAVEVLLNWGANFSDIAQVMFLISAAPFDVSPQFMPCSSNNRLKFLTNWDHAGWEDAADFRRCARALGSVRVLVTAWGAGRHQVSCEFVYGVRRQHLRGWILTVDPVCQICL